MRILDPSKLQPWAPQVFTDEEIAVIREELAHFARRQGIKFSDINEQARIAKRAADGGDYAWLSNNLPRGIVFSHLSAAVMVISYEYGHFVSKVSKDWVAHLDMQCPDGVERITRSVPELRAMVEPGFVIPRKSQT